MSRPGKIACIVLAAGLSKRFGSPKQLAKFEGKNLIQIAINQANGSTADYVFLVLGNSSSEILEKISLGRAQVIFNKDFAKGISTSIRSGISNLPGDCDAAIIMVADQPFLTSRHLDLMITESKKIPGRIVALSSKGEPRNPVLVPKEMFRELERLEGDAGARTMVRDNPKTLLVEITDPEVFVDVDTKDSLLDLKK